MAVLMYDRADDLSQNISHTLCEHPAISADLIVTSNNTMSYFLQYCVSLYLFVYSITFVALHLHASQKIIDPGVRLRARLTSHLIELTNLQKYH